MKRCKDPHYGRLHEHALGHKEAPVLITRIHSQHPVVDILLCTWWLVARGQKTTGRGGEQTGLQPCGLSVVVVTVTITFRYVLKNNPPVSFNIDSSGDLHIISCRRTEVTCRTNPVCGVIGRLSWGCSSVEGKVEGFFFCFGNSFNKIISRLIGKVWILLQEKRVFGYLVSNVIGWVFFIFYAVWEVTFSGAFWGSFGIAVTLAGLLWGVVVGRVLMWRCLRSIGREILCLRLLRCVGGEILRLKLSRGSRRCYWFGMTEIRSTSYCIEKKGYVTSIKMV